MQLILMFVAFLYDEYILLSNLLYSIASIFQCHYHTSLVVYQDTFILYLSAADFDF